MKDAAIIKKRRYAFVLLSIFVLALILRVGYAAAQGLPPDTDKYHLIASNMLSSNGFAFVPGRPTAYRPPSYPLFLAAWEGLFGTAWAAIIAQCVLTSLAAVMVFYVTRAILSDIAGLFAAGIVAIDPYEIAVSGQFMTEALFLFMVTAAFALFMRALKGPSPLKYVAAGVVAGAAAVTRPEFILFVPMGAVATFLWGRRAKKRVWLCGVVFLAAGLVLPAVWAARNHRALGSCIFTTTHGGYTHRLAYNSVFYDEVIAGKSEVWESESLENWQAVLESETAGMTEQAADRHHYRMAAGFIMADPKRAAKVALYEAGSFWRGYPHGVATVPALVAGMFFFALAGLALVGVYAAWKRGSAVRIIVFILLVETLVHSYYWSNIRMRVPFHPLLAVAAGLGLAILFRRKIGDEALVKTVAPEPICSPAV